MPLRPRTRPIVIRPRENSIFWNRNNYQHNKHGNTIHDLTVYN